MTSQPTLTSRELEARYACRDTLGGLEIVFDALAPLQLASKNHLSFLANEKYVDQALESEAGGILCSPKMFDELSNRARARLFVCDDPYVTFARVSQYFFKPRHPFEGISQQAVIDSSAKIHPSATVFPFVFIGPGAVVGANTVLYSGVFIGAASEIGADCILYPNVVVREGCVLGDRCVLNPGAVLGGDGFGFAPSGMENVKIPQIGGVRIENDVEVGSNSSIDRGALSDTRIGAQTKIDSLVMVAHNVVIGKACFLAGLSGVAGSSELGDRVMLGGQVGISGHLKVGSFVTVLAQAGVTKSLPERGVYSGFPARPARQFNLQMALLSKMARAQESAKVAEASKLKAHTAASSEDIPEEMP